jgi:hypothetical protein
MMAALLPPPPAPRSQADAMALAVSVLNDDLLDATLRLIDKPAEARVLGGPGDGHGNAAQRYRDDHIGRHVAGLTGIVTNTRPMAKMPR